MAIDAGRSPCGLRTFRIGKGLTGQQVHRGRAAGGEDDNARPNDKTEIGHLSGDSRQGCFHQLGPIAGADRQNIVVEVVAGLWTMQPLGPPA